MARKEGRGKQHRAQRARGDGKPIGPTESHKPTDEELEALKPSKEEIRAMREEEDE